MKYDAKACKFNMDTGCVELLLQNGRMISICSRPDQRKGNGFHHKFRALCFMPF